MSNKYHEEQIPGTSMTQSMPTWSISASDNDKEEAVEACVNTTETSIVSEDEAKYLFPTTVQRKKLLNVLV